MASESRMKTWPHSVHSLSAVSSLVTELGLMSNSSPSACEVKVRNGNKNNQL